MNAPADARPADLLPESAQADGPYVGRSMQRVEDLRLLRGKGRFADDIALPGMLHAALLRSSVAHARVRAIDTRAARALPGVEAVITAAEIVGTPGSTVPTVPLRLQPLECMEPYRQPVIAQDRIRHVGEVIAIVVADSLARAEDALDAIEVDLEALPAVADWRDSARDETLLFEATGTNRGVTFTARRGDIDAAFGAAAHVQHERFTVQRQAPVTMETRGVVADWDSANARLIVYGAAKVPFFNRAASAAMLGMPLTAVDFIEGDTGGSFGARGEFYVEDFLIPFAARHVGRPVKWICDRREDLMTMAQSRECEAELEMAFAADGTILGVRGSAWCDLGAYPRTNGLIQPRNIPHFLTNAYRIEAVDVASHVQFTNKGPAGTYRAPGRFETTLFCERLLELGSRALGLDPIDVRRRNLVTAADMPWHFATLTPSAPESTGLSEADSGDYRSTFERCLTEFDWAGKQALQGKLIDGRRHGIGLGCFIEGGAAGPRENAKIELARDGSVTLYVGSTSVGQGLETSLGQIAADALGIPMSKLTLLHGSTTYLSEGFGSYHSRSTVMGGSALIDAAGKFKQAVRDAAATYLECLSEQVVLDGTEARSPRGRTIGFAELGRNETISVEGTFANHHHTWAYGCAAAHVAVDPRTGHVALLDYLVVEDVGRAVNPLLLHGQVIGGTVQGLGGVFLEQMIYDGEGQMLTGSLADYLVPTASDFPNLRAIALEEYPSPINALGAKGAGEGGTIVVGAVLVNAIANALATFGVNPTTLPLSPSRLWHLIDDARAR
ncbi:MAG: xanthine dehydrogenase family protein molybdopterin-binding subunit [Proteobacteria bacterium]|nr:xanthine dehydrogenase family protein molybdopterin-binding subunit [Burkholderiales bacterium]